MSFRKLALLAAMSLTGSALLIAQSRIIVIGAHPDDCDIGFGGSAAKLAAAGHKVKFISVTNGDAGHQSMGGGALAKRRRAEAQESGRRLGIEYEVLDNHDGELMPSLNARLQLIRKIREWNADVVIGPRPNDYHPDHRYTGMLLQDAAYMVVVPNIAPDTPPLRKNPVFFYLQDHFQRPNPHRPDVVIAIDDVFEKKINAMDAHESQFYEWLPWVDGILDQVPTDKTQRKVWLQKRFEARRPAPAVREALLKWYGPDKGAQVKWAEALEICEYGKQPTEAEIRALLPVIGK
jgi:LmbE family N-acetylglucosaminyl deacetylase